MRRGKIKEIVAVVLVIMFAVMSVPVQAQAAIRISAKTKTLVVGESFTLKIAGTTSAIKWSTDNKKVASVSKNGKVTAKKQGTATIKAKVSKKTLRCKITVKEKAESNNENSLGSRTNPLSAYDDNTFELYDYEQYIGKFKVRLLEYKDGKEANDLIMQNDFNEPPANGQEYIHLKFEIHYISGEKEISATDVINHYSNFYNFEANKQVEEIDYGVGYDDSVEDMVNISLYPGGSATCRTAILIKTGNSPITYRIQTGYNKKNYEPVYTWFTTSK